MIPCLHCGHRTVRPESHEFSERFGRREVAFVVRDVPRCGGCGEWYFAREIVQAVDLLLAWQLVRARARSPEARAVIDRAVRALPTSARAAAQGRRGRATFAALEQVLAQRANMIEPKLVQLATRAEPQAAPPRRHGRTVRAAR